MKERITEDFVLPSANSYVRLLTAKDRLHNKDMRLLLVHGGVLICKHTKNTLVALTVFSATRFARFQQRKNSRFVPVQSDCYLLKSVEVAG